VWHNWLFLGVGVEKFKNKLALQVWSEAHPSTCHLF